MGALSRPLSELLCSLFYFPCHCRICFFHDSPNLLQSWYAFFSLHRREYHRCHVFLTWTVLIPFGVVYTRYSPQRCTSQHLRRDPFIPLNCRSGPRMIQPTLTGPTPFLTGGRNLDQSEVPAIAGRRSIVNRTADLTRPMPRPTLLTPFR